MLPLNDLTRNAQVAPALRPAAITSNTTTNGVTLDCINAAVNAPIQLLINPGLIQDGTYVLQVRESDNADMSSSVAVTDGPEAGTTTLTSANSNGSMQVIRFGRTRRYVRLAVTSTSVTSGAVLAATYVAPKNRPGETAAVP